MKRLITLAACAVAVSLSACATFDPVAFAEASTKAREGCDLDVDVQVTPMLLFGWPIPVISGSLKKACKDQPVAQVAP